MNAFEETLIRIDQFCFHNSIDYAVIGGAAVIFYGYLRTTRDIDLTVLCNLEELESIHKKIVINYNTLPKNSLEFFSKNFVLPVLDKKTNIRIDFAAGLTEFDKSVVGRRHRKFIGEAEVFFCSLEDLVIYKLFASRDQDLVDVKYLIEKNKDSLDKTYLIKSAEQFKKLEREDIIDKLHKLLNE